MGTNFSYIFRGINLSGGILWEECVFVCVCVCVCEYVTGLGMKVDQGFPCVCHHIPRSSGEPL